MIHRYGHGKKRGWFQNPCLLVSFCAVAFPVFAEGRAAAEAPAITLKSVIRWDGTKASTFEQCYGSVMRELVLAAPDVDKDKRQAIIRQLSDQISAAMARAAADFNSFEAGQNNDQDSTMAEYMQTWTGKVLTDFGYSSFYRAQVKELAQFRKDWRVVLVPIALDFVVDGHQLISTVGLVDKLELAARHCASVVSSEKAGKMARASYLASQVFAARFSKECGRNALFREQEIDCEELAKKVTDLSAIEIGWLTLGYNGGGIPVEEAVFKEPRSDDWAVRFAEAMADRLGMKEIQQTPEGFIDKISRAEMGRRQQTREATDLWLILRQAAGFASDDQIDPRAARGLFTVLSLLANTGPQKDRLARLLLANRQYARYARLFPALFGTGGTLVANTSYGLVDELFGQALPDRERSYHAVAGAFQGCLLREDGYPPEVVAETGYLVGLIYEAFSCNLIPGCLIRSVTDDRASSITYSVPEGYWNESVRKYIMAHGSDKMKWYLQAGLNDAQKHRVGAEFAANLCLPRSLNTISFKQLGRIEP